MVEIIIDTSRISSLNESSQHDQIKYKYRIQDAEVLKDALLKFIKNNTYKHDINEKQYIFIKPCKTSTKIIYDLHAVTDINLKILLQRHLHLK